MDKMAILRDQMVDSLKSLDEIDRVTVNVSDGNKTIYVKYETYRSLDFKFVWSNDHFIGYSITKIRGKKAVPCLPFGLQWKRPNLLQPILYCWVYEPVGSRRGHG